MTLYNPFARFGVSQGWHGAHQAVDFRTPYSTACGAPEDGTYFQLPDRLSRTDPTAPGRWGELRLASGDKLRFCHLEAHLVKSGAKVVKGQLIIDTGNSGYVKPTPSRDNPYAGSHMHTYGLRANGARFDWTRNADAVCRGVVNTKSGLKLRAKPTTLSASLGVAPYGTKVIMLAVSGVWWQVKWNNKIGWMHAGYLS